MEADSLTSCDVQICTEHPAHVPPGIARAGLDPLQLRRPDVRGAAREMGPAPRAVQGLCRASNSDDSAGQAGQAASAEGRATRHRRSRCNDERWREAYGGVDGFPQQAW